MSNKLRKQTVAATTKSASSIKKHTLPLIALFTLLVSVVIYFSTFIIAPSTQAEEITVYKSPTCGCCKKWVSHLETSGFDVTAHNRKNMSPIKQQFGIAPQQQSCHTAVVNGYVIEGHVSAVDIKRLLAEKPDIRGLTVPGMPMGSPSMEGPRKDNYNVLAIDKHGNTTVFSQH